jgi:uncharacterized damage-inducible protein DinB
VSRNPYAGALGQREPVEVIATTPEKLEKLLAKRSPEQIEQRPAPGKWSLREIMAHLADCELAFGFRLRQGAAGVEMIQPFDQDDWARNYGAYDFAAAMTTYRALRAWNLAFIHSLTEEQKARAITHPERGTMTTWTIVETMAGHDLHHLTRLEKQLPG